MSFPGLTLGESDTAVWKLKCLWKELLIFDQLESPCYWLWLHKCTTLITAFNKLSFLPSHILCIVVQLIFSFLLCSPSLPAWLFMEKRGLRSLQRIQCPNGSCHAHSAHGSVFHSFVHSRELSFSCPAKIPASAAAQELVVSRGTRIGLWGTTPHSHRRSLLQGTAEQPLKSLCSQRMYQLLCAIAACRGLSPSLPWGHSEMWQLK